MAEWFERLLMVSKLRVFCIASLQDRSSATFQAVLNMLLTNKVW